MRHHLVVNLQPIGMIYEVMDRRLRAPEPDLANVHESAHKINGFARAALDSCLDVVTWLAPEEGTTTTAAEGARECTGLMTTSLSFRGYAVRNDVGDVPGQVSRPGMRNVLTAVLMYATDQLAPPAELVLTAQTNTGGLLVKLEVRHTQGSQGFANEAAYRRLDWGDVQALAAAESVELVRRDKSMSMVFPWVTAKA